MGHTESNNIMKRKIIFAGLAVAVVIVATALVVMQRSSREQKADHLNQKSEIRSPKSEAVSQNTEAFKQKVLASPEEFQTQTVVKREAPVPLTVPTNRPKQLSEVAKLEREKTKKEPVAAKDLYFWKDFQSLRKDEIRNPDSKENREGVVALMKIRQQRVGQE